MRRSFSDIYKELQSFEKPTGPTPKRSLEALYRYALKANKLDGIAAEAGVFRGSSLFVIANAFDGQIQAFDSWTGFPEPSEYDAPHHKKGRFYMPIDEAQKRLSFTDRVSWHKGYFDDILPTIPVDTKYSFVYVDVDLYYSVKSCFRFFWPKMIHGGVLIFDDYVCLATPGATKAINEMVGYPFPSHATIEEYLVVLRS